MNKIIVKIFGISGFGAYLYCTNINNMYHVINPTKLSKSQYEAEFQAILIECEERYNEANNYTTQFEWHGYLDPAPYYYEAEHIFFLKFGISYNISQGYNLSLLAEDCL